MAQRRKLQIFVSSTYSDLRAERQAAVEAILTAGHIPAGMELFTAGDESQMDVIKRWIDESDIYMLILGGRYGSIEPKSQKSYIHLEYEYAVEKGKPLFAIVIEENHLEARVKKHGSAVMEKDNPQKLKEFRALVLTKMSRFWCDPRDIKLAILETVAEFSHRENLVGWIPGSEAVDSGAVAEEIARLAKENASLREQLRQASASSVRYNGLTFDEMCQLLTSNKMDLTNSSEDVVQWLRELAKAFGDPDPSLLHAFWALREGFVQKIELAPTAAGEAWRLAAIGLVEPDELSKTKNTFKLTESGKQFLLRLKLERGNEMTEKYIS